jgi:hypothetical protein
MRLRKLGLIGACALGMSSTAFTANRTYYLALPARSEGSFGGESTSLRGMGHWKRA